ncbi:UNVERIFIED_CONTAM: hypothetical protein Sradi_5454300 [Sesamum radiatum]|uniref:Uncharacterized protein n=1 Tax=Sesamum radiatum TaxID=300843 RepID=A0AAW2LDE2_SESRA
MPGTIQVTGYFIFIKAFCEILESPITKLRENLVVALLDAGGNEIAHADIRTMQIIEKGSWDEVFSINGGGHVHMKLQFILSDEERKRIRSVDTTDRSQGAPQLHEQVPAEKSKMRPIAGVRSDVHQWASSKLSESAISGKRNLVVTKLQDHPIQESRNQEPVEKTPSNVRKSQLPPSSRMIQLKKL